MWCSLVLQPHVVKCQKQSVVFSFKKAALTNQTSNMNLGTLIKFDAVL